MIDLNSQKTATLSTQVRGQQPLYESGQLQHKSVSAMRASFNHWIRSLPMEERFLALKIHSAPLPQTLRKFFSQIEESHQDRCIQIDLTKHEPSKDEQGGDSRKTGRKLQKSFYDSLVFVTDGHDYLDHICFQFGLLECPQKLFDFLVATLDPSCSKPMLEALKNQLSVDKISERILKVKTKEQAIVQILNYLRQQVFLRFREIMLDSQFITRNLDQQKRRKKEFNLFWKHLSHQLRYNLLLLNCPNITQLHKQLTVNDIFISHQQLKIEIEDLLKLQKNQFCNRIFKCKLKKSDSAVVDYYQLVYQLWKKDLEKSKKKKGQKHTNEREKEKNPIKPQKDFITKKSKNVQHRKSNSLQSNETNVTDNQKINERQDKSRMKIEIHIQKQQHFKHEEESVQVEKETYRKLFKEQKAKTRHKNKSKHQTRQKEKHQKMVYKPQEHIDLECINPQKKKENGPIRKSSFFQEQLKQAQLYRLSQQLQDMSDKTSQQANKYHDRRVIAFERIQYLLAFYNISIRLFGSCASGIAIKNSDIDIAVDNSILLLYDYLPENLKLLGALQSLQQVFASQSCFTYIKLIKTASIPVIKLTIDTSLQFLNPYYGQVYHSLNRPHFSGPIEADITIQTVNKLSQCNHLGLISTQAINQWLSQISSLHTIVIFMKQALKNHRFNITYQGGLNTFAMIVLLVSYIRHHQLEKQTNSARVLQQILHFYAHQFDEKEYGIDLLRSKQRPIFYKKQAGKNQNSKDAADLQILDPKCEGKNMTRNCYQFADIKKLFKQILSVCFADPAKQATRWGEQLERQRVLEKMRKVEESHNVFTQFLTC